MLEPLRIRCLICNVGALPATEYSLSFGCRIPRTGSQLQNHIRQPKHFSHLETTAPQILGPFSNLDLQDPRNSSQDKWEVT